MFSFYRVARTGVLAAVCLPLMVSCSTIKRVPLDAPALKAVERVGVIAFEDAPGADAGRSGQVVASVVSGQLKANTQWRVFERMNLKEILDELKIQTTSLVDASTMGQLGSLMGVQTVVVGNVSQYEIGSIPFLFFLVFDKNVYRVSFSCRMVAVETGEVLWSASTSGTSFDSMEDAATVAAHKLFQISR